jgi:uncharacterized protein YjbI with pentapeptide repeats
MDDENAAGIDEFEPPKYLTSLIGAVNDAAKTAQGGAFVFLLVGVYLLAATFSTSDEDLLLGRSVTISQLGASLPVSFSFAIAPLVFLFLHVYTLVRYDMLAANVRQYRRELSETVPRESNRERCRQLVTNVEFVEALITPRGSESYSVFWPWLFRGILAAFPVMVLLLVQINTLRYQSGLITWAQRTWLALDLVALVWFFRRDPLGGSAWPERRTARVLRWSRLLCVPAALVALNLFYLKVVPADEDGSLVRYRMYHPDENFREWLSHNPAKRPLDLVLCPWLNLGCRFLNVSNRTLVGKVWDEKAMVELRTGSLGREKALAGIEGVELQDRSLRFAMLDGSRLYAADLFGADLRNATLFSANLIGANLIGSKLQNAILINAKLQGADLRNAKLQAAILIIANLQGAELSNAQLWGAKLQSVKLEAADLNEAELQGANLTKAELQGASFFKTQLQFTDLTGVQLQGSDLHDAQLWHAEVDPARPANLALADVRDANFGPPPPDAVAKVWNSIHDIPDEDLRAEAEQRMARAVAEAEAKAAGKAKTAVPGFSFAASQAQPVLASEPWDSNLAAHADWLVSTPTPAYTAALADYFASKLSHSDPAVATAIARRTAESLSRSQDATVRVISAAIARRLLSEPNLNLEQAQIDALTSALYVFTATQGRGLVKREDTR